MPGNIHEVEGDLFDAPDGAALIHACNCQGSWAAGVARGFRNRYPAAYQIYRSHCQKLSSKPQRQELSKPSGKSGSLETSSKEFRLPEGTALIIPPQKKDHKGGNKRHWVICLFTSRGYGKRVSPPKVILENTGYAVANMKEQLAQLEDKEGGQPPNALWSCRFNSGLFGVKWELSKQVLEDAGLDVTVVRPPGE